MQNDYSFPKNELRDLINAYDFSGIQEKISNNAIEAAAIGKLIYPTRSAPLFNPRLYSIDGSIKIPTELFQKSAPKYFLRSRRYIDYKGYIHLRGSRYMISSNPTFEVRQKLLTLKEDFYEGLQEITNQLPMYYQLGIADYIKNSIVTMLNAMVCDEKSGKFKFDSIKYTKLRSDAIQYAQASVTLFYSILLQYGQIASSCLNILYKHKKVFERIQTYVLEEYHGGMFSSRHLTRPEASHPLVIASCVALSTQRLKKDPIDIIIGMPSGSTELALAHAFGQSIINSSRKDVLLFPISIHSSKQSCDASVDTSKSLPRWIKNHRNKLCGASILIVDDNTSTGQTIQLAANAISKAAPERILVSVSEADIIRSKIDLHEEGRPFIANPALYNFSTNILPISRKISPKTDIKELYEKRKVVKCIYSRYCEKPETDPITNIIGNLYIDLVRFPSHGSSSIDNYNTINGFQKTFLSNFFPVKVERDGQYFLSVEHAYQAMKLPPQHSTENRWQHSV